MSKFKAVHHEAYKRRRISRAAAGSVAPWPRPFTPNNKVVIAGRDANKLSAVVKANPGIEARELDVTDPVAIKSFARQATDDFPALTC